MAEPLTIWMIFGFVGMFGYSQIRNSLVDKPAPLPVCLLVSVAVSLLGPALFVATLVLLMLPREGGMMIRRAAESQSHGSLLTWVGVTVACCLLAAQSVLVLIVVWRT